MTLNLCQSRARTAEDEFSPKTSMADGAIEVGAAHRQSVREKALQFYLRLLQDDDMFSPTYGDGCFGSCTALPATRHISSLYATTSPTLMKKMISA